MDAVRELVNAYEKRVAEGATAAKPTADDIKLETRHFERALEGARPVWANKVLEEGALETRVALMAARPLTSKGFVPSLTAKQLESYAAMRRLFASDGRS